jgi:hypothetical protein
MMNGHEEFRIRILQRASDSNPVEQALEDEMNCYDSRTSRANQKLETVPMKPTPEVRRSMGTKTTPSGKAVTCTVCSWWAPMIGRDIRAAGEEFDAHICAAHPPVKGIEKPSNAK